MKKVTIFVLMLATLVVVGSTSAFAQKIRIDQKWSETENGVVTGNQKETTLVTTPDYATKKFVRAEIRSEEKNFDKKFSSLGDRIDSGFANVESGQSALQGEMQRTIEFQGQTVKALKKVIEGQKDLGVQEYANTWWVIAVVVVASLMLVLFFFRLSSKPATPAPPAQPQRQPGVDAPAPAPAPAPPAPAPGASGTGAPPSP